MRPTNAPSAIVRPFAWTVMKTSPEWHRPQFCTELVAPARIPPATASFKWACPDSDHSSEWGWCSPVWHTAHSAEPRLTVGRNDRSSMFSTWSRAGPWQVSQPTPARSSVVARSTNPPDWPKPTVWHGRQMEFVSWPIASSVSSAPACSVWDQFVWALIWHKLQRAEPTYLPVRPVLPFGGTPLSTTGGQPLIKPQDKPTRAAKPIRTSRLEVLDNLDMFTLHHRSRVYALKPDGTQELTTNSRQRGQTTTFAFWRPCDVPLA